MIAEGKIALLDIGQVAECPQPISDGLAYIATPPTAPPAIVIQPQIGREAATIAVRAAAPSVLPDETISIGEPITFPTSHGAGHAFWYPPKNRDYEGPANALPPLVVLSHGGPTSMTTNHFSLNVQWWTSRGIGVVDVNYGGSTGFGRAYRRLLDRQWGIGRCRGLQRSRTIPGRTRAGRWRPPRHSRRQRRRLHHARGANLVRFIQSRSQPLWRRGFDVARQGHA